MKSEELELFKSMLEMLGNAGDVSVWLVIGWWGMGLLKIIIVFSFISWVLRYLVSVTTGAYREITLIEDWVETVQSSKTLSAYCSREAAKHEIDKLIKREYEK